MDEKFYLKIEEIVALTDSITSEIFKSRSFLEDIHLQATSNSEPYICLQGHFSMYSFYRFKVKDHKLFALLAKSRVLPTLFCRYNFVVSFDFQFQNIYIHKVLKEALPPFWPRDAIESKYWTYIDKKNFSAVATQYDYTLKLSKELTQEEKKWLREWRWANRRMCLLVALRIQNGNFFHVLKYLALFI